MFGAARLGDRCDDALLPPERIRVAAQERVMGELVARTGAVAQVMRLVDDDEIEIVGPFPCSGSTCWSSGARASG
jgi:hypothetical protein